MATVRGVIADRIACGVTLVVRGSTSTNTGRRLFQTIAAAAARKVKLGITTSPSGSVRVPVRATPNRESGSIEATAHGSSNDRRLRQLPAARSSARYTSIRPTVQLLTATACRTPSRFATACSRRSQYGPFVNRPLRMISSNAGCSDSAEGSAGRTNGTRIPCFEGSPLACTSGII